MADKQNKGKSKSMASADVANGEAPDADSKRDDAERRRARRSSDRDEDRDVPEEVLPG